MEILKLSPLSGRSTIIIVFESKVFFLVFRFFGIEIMTVLDLMLPAVRTAPGLIKAHIPVIRLLGGRKIKFTAALGAFDNPVTHVYSSSS